MALNYDTLRRWQIADVERSYDARDTILYALGLGIGGDPCDPAQLQFLHEDGLRALPSMAVVLAYPPLWYWRPPEGEPERTVRIPTLPQAALVYRLSGDANPLHADPRHARAAGFDRPILHGRCTFGIAAWALVQAYCPMAPERLTAMSARFARPVFPGEALLTRMWRQGGRIAFETLVEGRGTPALARGTAVIAQDDPPPADRPAAGGQT